MIGSVTLDIKIGFADTPRELVISSAAEQDKAVQDISTALQGEGGLLQLEDEKGRKYLINVERIAYVEVGTTTQRSVGFIA